MKVLNLGCGKKIKNHVINVDVMPYPRVDEVLDLSYFPWPWKDNSIDGIHASHIMEHFPDQFDFIMECHRVLKPGGFLRIVGPHSSCITSVGCLGHYRTYAYSTFDDYLSNPFYLFKDPLFKTTEMQLRWWHEEIDAEGNFPRWMIAPIKVVDLIMNWIIALSPRLFENVFCSFIQCREVIWQGVKL